MNEKREVRDGMRIDRNVPIETDDGREVRADANRPIATGRDPVYFRRARTLFHRGARTDARDRSRNRSEMGWVRSTV